MWTEKQEEELRRLWFEGYSSSIIAIRLHRTEATIRKRVRKLHLEKRDGPLEKVKEIPVEEKRLLEPLNRNNRTKCSTVGCKGTVQPNRSLCAECITNILIYGRRKT